MEFEFVKVENKRQIAISDIHAHPKTLDALLFNQLRINNDDELFFLGDYVGRGPNAVKVLDMLLELKKQNYHIHILRGNHDHELYLSEKRKANKRKMPDVYFNFLDDMDFYFETDDFYLVHSGFESVSNPDFLENKHEMMYAVHWKYPINERKILKNKRVITGHNVTSKERILQMVENKEDLVIIDNGIFLSKEEGFGHICAFDFKNDQLWFQENIDRR